MLPQAKSLVFFTTATDLLFHWDRGLILNNGYVASTKQYPLSRLMHIHKT